MVVLHSRFPWLTKHAGGSGTWLVFFLSDIDLMQGSSWHKILPEQGWRVGGRPTISPLGTLQQRSFPYQLIQASRTALQLHWGEKGTHKPVQHPLDLETFSNLAHILAPA